MLQDCYKQHKTCDAGLINAETYIQVGCPECSVHTTLPCSSFVQVLHMHPCLPCPVAMVEIQQGTHLL